MLLMVTAWISCLMGKKHQFWTCIGFILKSAEEVSLCFYEGRIDRHTIYIHNNFQSCCSLQAFCLCGFVFDRR